MCDQMLMAIRHHFLRLNQPSHIVLCLLLFLVVWLTIQLLLLLLGGLNENSEAPLSASKADIQTSRGKAFLLSTRHRSHHKIHTSRATPSQDVQAENKNLRHQVKDSKVAAASSEWDRCYKETLQSSHVLHSNIVCDAECSNFHSLMSRWPRTKPKAAIYYLTKASRVEELTGSLKLLYRNFIQQFRYPVIIFHEKSLEVDTRNRYRSLANFDLFFQEIEFTFPRHINNSLVAFDIRCLSHISYRHMCHFQARGVYEQPILAQLEYVWRLDDDSQVLDVVQFDVFDFMRTHRLQYGYIKIHVDAFICTEGLWDATNYYIKQQQFVPQFFDEWPEPRIYYNNFELSSLAVWRSPDYQNYVKFIDCLGGIYYNRWGDAPIKSIAVSLFVQKTATYRFASVAYRHGHFVTNSSYSSF